ncbi:DUF3307 domain-containing protein [candidate division KSB1 bacterium]|nr:DUF3307 domain-containing protein [candidate division KSB1 bacterium]
MPDLFWLILIAHLIADFPLQTDRIYALKEKYVWGALPHVAIFFIFSIALALPFIKTAAFWKGLILLTTGHGIIDWLKTCLTKKYFKDSLLFFLIDQCTHIMLIWIVAYKVIRIEDGSSNLFVLSDFFLNSHCHIIISGLIFSVFGGTIINHYIKIWRTRKKHSNANQTSIQFPAFRERIPGYVERSILFSAMMAGGYFFIAVPFAFLPAVLVRYLMGYKKNGSHENIFTNFLVVAVTALLIHFVGAAYQV